MATTPPQFVHLHVHSHYSLLDGLPRIRQIVERVKALKMPAVALTDHGALYGAVEFYKEAVKAGIKPIIGVEAYVAPNGMHLKRPSVDTKRYHLPLLAETTEGYNNLLKLVSKSYLEGFYYKPRIDHDILRKYAKGLIGLSGCLQGEIPQALRQNNYGRAKEIANLYRDIFGSENFFIELQVHPSIPEQQATNEKLKALAKELRLPVVATNDAHYLSSDDADAQDVLICVQTGKTIDDTDRLSMRNEDLSLLPAEEMVKRFADTPEAVANTVNIAQRCAINIPLGNITLPHFETPDGVTADEHLKQLCESGIAAHYGSSHSPKQKKEITDRLNYELRVILNMEFASYFLIVQDFVNWAKNQHIAVGPGRGSAAGSIVAYLLGITDLDPLRYNLLFERFLNPGRNEMPDIDLDFADTRRDRVIEYVRQRYGYDRVAQIITFGTMGARAAVRDVGRALGYAYGFCDQIAKMIPFGSSLNEALEEAADLKESYETDPEVKRLIDMAKKLEGVARHTSTHAAGVVITPKPLTEYLPLQFAAQDDRSIVTQYEMHAVEDLGLLKMDFLGLTNLTIIERTIKIIKRTQKKEIDIGALPLDDRTTFELLQRGETAGVFQLESAGMRRYLKMLKPTEFEDIVAMVALYRPGPLETGMVEEYIQRKHGRKKIEYLHDRLKSILKNTYGVLVYQEQLMQLAQELGGFSLSEADVLRKAVGKKIKKLLDEQREKLINGMTENGIDDTTARRIWDFIEPFARYGFNRSHSACYAMIAYQTAYLKANYTEEFMAALMTSDKNDIEKVALRVEECRSMGIPILPPDINESWEDFTHVIINDPSAEKISGGKKAAIRFGLGAIKNLGSNVVHAIDRDRAERGPYRSLNDFLLRLGGTDVNRKSLESLIKAGAMDIFGERALLLTNIEPMLAHIRERNRSAREGQTSLFVAANQESADALPVQKYENIPQRKLLDWERQLLGIYLTDHPLDEYAAIVKHIKATPCAELLSGGPRSSVIGAGIITAISKITTKTGEPMLFITLEDKTGRVEAVIFPRILKEHARILREGNAVAIHGKLTERNDRLNILCDRIKELAAINPEARKKNSVVLSLPEGNGAEDLLSTLQAALASLPRGPYNVTVHFVDSEGNKQRLQTRHAIASPDGLKDRLKEFDGGDAITIHA